MGEWQSHPETCPSPSGVDVEQWQQHSRETSDEAPLLAVITGTEQLYVALLRHGNARVPLDCLLADAHRKTLMLEFAADASRSNRISECRFTVAKA